MKSIVPEQFGYQLHLVHNDMFVRYVREDTERLRQALCVCGSLCIKPDHLLVGRNLSRQGSLPHLSRSEDAHRREVNQVLNYVTQKPPSHFLRPCKSRFRFVICTVKAVGEGSLT